VSGERHAVLGADLARIGLNSGEVVVGRIGDADGVHGPGLAVALYGEKNWRETGG